MNFNTLPAKCGVLLESFFCLNRVKSLKRHIFSQDHGRGLGERLQRHNALRQLVRECLEAPLGELIQAAVMEGQRLTLFVPSPVWASRLRYKTPELQRLLQQRGVLVERIGVRIIPESRPDNQSPYPRPRRLSEENSEILRQTAQGLEDGPLREALLRLSRHQR